jgi:hypothetical protein
MERIKMLISTVQSLKDQLFACHWLLPVVCIMQLTTSLTLQLRPNSVSSASGRCLLRASFSLVYACPRCCLRLPSFFSSSRSVSPLPLLRPARPLQAPLPGFSRPLRTAPRARSHWTDPVRRSEEVAIATTIRQSPSEKSMTSNSVRRIANMADFI